MNNPQPPASAGIGILILILVVVLILVFLLPELDRFQRRRRIEFEEWEKDKRQGHEIRRDEAKCQSDEKTDNMRTQGSVQRQTWAHSAANDMAQKDVDLADYEAKKKMETAMLLTEHLTTQAPDGPFERLHVWVQGNIHDLEVLFSRNLIPRAGSSMNEPPPPQTPLPPAPTLPSPPSLPPPPFPADGRSYEIPDPNGQWLNEEDQGSADNDDGGYDEDDYDD